MQDIADIELREGYKKTVLGYIPSHWNILSLNKIGVFSKGKGISKAEIVENGSFPCVRYAEIYTLYDYYAFSFESRIDEESAIDSKEICEGDLLFAGSGETLEDIGKSVAYLGKEKAFAGGDIIIFKQHTEDSQYLGYLLNHEIVRRQLHKLGQGHSVVHVYPKSLEKIKVPLPPLPEQQKIAKILSTWDKVIARQKALISQKQLLKKGLMQQLLTGKKRFKDFDGEWKWVSLGEIARTFSGGTPLKSKSEFYNGEIHWIKSGELNNGIVVETEEFISELGLTNSSAKIVRPDTILVAMYGATAGVCAITKIEGAINQAILAIEHKKEIDKYFLFQLLRKKMPKTVFSMVQGGQPNLSGGIIKKMKLKIPKLIEQQKIAFVLSASDQEISLLNRHLKKLQKQKRGLMQKLLTGEIRVKV